jgi:hypothetical protein
MEYQNTPEGASSATVKPSLSSGRILHCKDLTLLSLSGLRESGGEGCKIPYLPIPKVRRRGTWILRKKARVARPTALLPEQEQHKTSGPFLRGRDVNPQRGLLLATLQRGSYDPWPLPTRKGRKPSARVATCNPSARVLRPTHFSLGRSELDLLSYMKNASSKSKPIKVAITPKAKQLILIALM